MACQLGERVERTLADIAVVSLLREERLMIDVAAIGHGRLSLLLEFTGVVFAGLSLYVKVDFGNRFATSFLQLSLRRSCSILQASPRYRGQPSPVDDGR